MGGPYIVRGIDMDEDPVDESFTTYDDARAYLESTLYDVQQIIHNDVVIHQHVFGRPSWNANQ